MAEVNAEVKARSLSNQFGLNLSTAGSNNEGEKESQGVQEMDNNEQEPEEAPRFFRMRAASGGLPQQYNAINLMALEADGDQDEHNFH